MALPVGLWHGAGVLFQGFLLLLQLRQGLLHKPDTDLRLFTRTVRGSKAWKEVYKRRTTTERSIKRKKIDYRMEHTRVRSKRRRLWLLTLGAINQHLDAWRAEFPISIAELGAGGRSLSAITADIASILTRRFFTLTPV